MKHRTINPAETCFTKVGRSSFFKIYNLRRHILKITLFLVVMLTAVGVKAGDQDTLWTKRIGTVRSVKFAPDGSKVAAGTDKGEIFIYNSLTGVQIGFYSYGDYINKIDFSPDGKYIIACGSDTLNGQIKIWNFPENILFKILRDTSLGNLLTDSRTESFSKDGKYFCANFIKEGTQKEYSTYIWNIQDYTVVKQLSAPTRHCLFSPDSKKLIISTDGDSPNIMLYNTGTWTYINSLNSSPGSFIWDLKFSPDGKKLISGCEDGYIRIWDMETFKLIDTLKPAGGINSLVVSNDNQNIIVNYNGKYNQVYLNKYNMTNKNLLYEYNNNISGLGRETIKSIDYNSKQNLFATGGYSLAIFKADLISSVEENSTEEEVTLYPNPATNKASLKITLPVNDVYKISVTDLSGNELSVIQNSYLEAGEQTIEIDCSWLLMGAYIIKVSSTTFSKTFKLVKVQ